MSVDVSLYEEYSISVDDRIVDGILSSRSHTVRLMIEHVNQPKSKSRNIFTFHAATINSNLPNSADYHSTIKDPDNHVSRVHVYVRPAVDLVVDSTIT